MAPSTLSIFRKTFVLSLSRNFFIVNHVQSNRSISYQVIASPFLNYNKSRQYKEFARKFHSSSFLCEKDSYKILGVNKSATQEEIKKAYKKLVKETHPDTSKGGKLNHIELTEAYKVLSDVEKRKEYDTFGSGPKNSEGFNYSSGGEGTHYYGSANFNPEELFRNIFEQTRQNYNSGFGNFAESSYGFAPAAEIMMNLSFEEAAKGCNKTVTLNCIDVCPKCDGDKCELGTKKSKCHRCNGTGQETIAKGSFVFRTTCMACKGSKFIINTPCIECEGTGKTIQLKKVKVDVPAGVEDGQTVRIQVNNQEVFITFKVEKSKIFRRDGADIHSDVIISLSQAVLGGIVNVKGISEKLLLKIPAGTNSHEKFKMVGKGLPRSHSYGHGDHYIHTKIQVPKSLTAQQKALFKVYAEMDSEVNGTVDGLTNTAKGGSNNSEDGKEQKSDNDLNDESFFYKIKKKLLG